MPSQWKKAIIVPILKKDKPPNEISSYRPISLTSVVAKVMERMVSRRLTWYLESNNLLSTDQAGFRENHSTNEQVINISQDIKESFNKHEDTTAVFVDFQTAYDSVWRCKLLEKIQKLGIKKNMLQWLSDFITQRFCATRYQQALSTYKQTHVGLPQGSVLSTTLFNIYINDLPETLNIPKLKTALFADDLLFWTSESKKKYDKIKDTMQEALNKLHKWCIENLMTINIEKTKYQIFSLGWKERNIDLHYNGIQIQKTDNSKYLGVVFDTKLSWNKHTEKVCEKTTQRFNILKRLCTTKWGCSMTTLSSTYYTYVKPVLQYCGEILITSPANLAKLEKIQNQALRIITGGVKSTPVEAMRIITKNYPITLTLQEQAILLYEKLLRLPETKWRQRHVPSSTLSTQISFIEKVSDLLKTFEVSKYRELLYTHENPLEEVTCESLSVEFGFTLYNIL